MDTSFRGAAKRLDDIDLPRIGREIGVGEDELHAFLDVETRGSGFDSQGRPRILFERHKFYKYVPEKKRAAAVMAGLANTKPGGYGKESAQYGKLAKAIAIDREAALYSCSWGLAQVMGFNHKLAGYDTVDAMVEAFMADEENHLEAAVTFIKNAGLAEALRKHDWVKFAEGYNGENYKQNRYDAKLRDAFAKWQKIADTPYSPEAAPVPTQKPVLVEANVPEPAQASDKDTVMRVQKQLKDLGYTEVGAVDGKIGTMTATAVRAFRAENGLPEGDQIDDALLLALQKAKPRQIAPERSDAPPEVVRDKVPEVKTNWMTKIGAFFVGIVSLVGSFFDGIVGNLGAAAGYIKPLQDAAGDVPGWFWLLLIAVIAGGLYLVARHGEQKGVEAFQTGARR